jgi:lysozyme family protein
MQNIPFLTNLIDEIITKEGPYTNDPQDHGGPTKWGICHDVARKNGYLGDMTEFPRDKAVEIYTNDYWTAPGLQRIVEVDSQLAKMLLDYSVLCGTRKTIKMMQRALNVLTNNEKIFPKIDQDGKCGVLTQQALKALLKSRGEEGLKVLRNMVSSLQSVHLIECAETNPTNEKFEYGWQLNRTFQL